MESVGAIAPRFFLSASAACNLGLSAFRNYAKEVLVLIRADDEWMRITRVARTELLQFIAPANLTVR